MTLQVADDQIKSVFTFLRRFSPLESFVDCPDGANCGTGQQRSSLG